jgi:hypothetical protein
MTNSLMLGVRARAGNLLHERAVAAVSGAPNDPNMANNRAALAITVTARSRRR